MEDGYPGDMFVEPIDDYLVCTVCNKVMRSPRATPCGHVFCRGCIESWVIEYGVCPQRCRELELHLLMKAVHIETRISGLLVRCTNFSSGCIVHVPLVEKQRHEEICPHFGIVALRRTAPLDDKSTSPNPAAGEGSGGRRDRSRSLVDLGNFFKRTKLGLSFRTASSKSNASSPSPQLHTPHIQTPQGTMQTKKIFRLKRSQPREPLGLVLVSGSKTGDGRHRSYYVKKVNRDSLGYRAGLKAGDTIIQVDNYDLYQLSPQDSVSRIKEKQVITLTVLRDIDPKASKHDEHIYDEILYADLSQNLSQPNLLQDENYLTTPPPMELRRCTSPHRKHSMPLLDEQCSRPHRPIRPMSSTANYKISSTHGEQTSKDSGLSSGSSGSPNPAQKQAERLAVRPSVPLPHPPAISAAQKFNRDIYNQQSYRTEQEMLRSFLKTQKRNSPAPQDPLSLSQSAQSTNYRIEGEYEVEEIYLEKNGSNQLGITLGYDSSDQGGCLYICEILPGGLAANDGRLRNGDIVRKVNGFEVYDPEEAILLFLEQDQDITLTVARRIKVPSLRMQPHMKIDTCCHDVVMAGDDIPQLRRADSCGSLDSHTHHYAVLEPGPAESEAERRVSVQVQVKRPVLAAVRKSIEFDNVDYAWQHQKKHREASPIRNVSPLCGEFLSQQMMGSTPNLLRSSSRSPPSLSQPLDSHRIWVSRPPEPAPSRRRVSHDQPSSTARNTKHLHLGGMLSVQRKVSAPGAINVKSPMDVRPRNVVSPTKNLRGLVRSPRTTPHRMVRIVDELTILHGHTESLV